MFIQILRKKKFIQKNYYGHPNNKNKLEFLFIFYF